MNLGIGGKTAIVCAAGTDLGQAAALALVRENVEVTATEADVTINNLLPGTFETGPLKVYIENNARKEGIDAQTFTARLLGDNPLRRLGKPEEFGALCAFICSRQAGYINGQNILIDGGNFPGTF